jgi:hypothetical protein
MSTSPFFSQEELADAAFAMLTSSSLERYARMAQQSAVHAQLREQMQRNPQLIPDLIRRANELRRTILRSAQRDVSEVELAVLLMVLSPTAASTVDQLLLDLSIVNWPAVAWISGLARRILQERRGHAEVIVWQPQQKGARWETLSSADVRLGSGSLSPIETISSKAETSEARLPSVAA